LPLSYPHPLPLCSLSDALIAVEWGSARDKEVKYISSRKFNRISTSCAFVVTQVLEKKTRSYMRLTGDPRQVEGGAMCHGIRSIGCASYLYTQVATGSVDIYWEIGCYSWDVVRSSPPLKKSSKTMKLIMFFTSPIPLPFILIRYQCAGIVIAQEAGAKVYGKAGRPLDDNGEVLMGRDFLVIRFVSPAFLSVTLLSMLSENGPGFRSELLAIRTRRKGARCKTSSSRTFSIGSKRSVSSSFLFPDHADVLSHQPV
jgi:myo-inositol-1(or 4)-monophosphatase